MMNQFHAPLNENSTEYSGWPPSEPSVVISETEARRLVTAVENCRMSDAFAVIRRQPWFREVRDGVRTTRHLKPGAYIKLSERSAQLPTS